MAAPRRLPLHLLLVLLLTPVVWCLLGYTTVLGRLNNIAMDWLYRFRGEIPAYDGTKPGDPPLKIVYVDVDAPTIQMLGNLPYDRDFYARIANAVLKYGDAKTVGLDFILSPAGLQSKLVDQDKAREGNRSMGILTSTYGSKVVLAAMYSNMLRQTPDGKVEVVAFPYLHKGFTDPKKNGYPEAPTYPIVTSEYGHIGLINVATDFNLGGTPDDVPRWVPMFAESEGTDRAQGEADAMIQHNKLPVDSMMSDDNSIIILDGTKTQVLATLVKMEHSELFHMSLELALSYLGLNHKNVHRTDRSIEIADDAGKILLNIPLTRKQLVEVNWFSKWKNPVLNPRASAVAVIEIAKALETGDAEAKAKAEKFFAMFKDAIVLIGPTDPVLQDIAPTPFDGEAQPKVGVYGNLLKTMFTGEYVRHTPNWSDPLILFALSFIVGGLAVYSGRWAGLAKAAALVILVGYGLFVFEAFAHFTLVFPLIAPVGAAGSTAFAGAVMRLIDEEKQKKRITGMFGTYLAPAVVSRMVESGEEPQLGGHNEQITCFFSDVQGFSTFSEVLSPGDLTNLMNEYFTPLTDLLQAEGGTLDKFIGDAIVAMYGAPLHLEDHALRSCVAACQMQKRLGELRAHWKSLGAKWPEKVHGMRMRIGLNTGEAIVGNMGSKSRFNYTMMGDTVNLGARCESAAKSFGVYTMCTEDTKKAALAVSDEILFRRLNKIIVKGRTLPVEIFEVVGLRAEATPETLRCIELFEKALELYFAQKWDEAKALFAEAHKLEPLQPGRDIGVAHNPSELMQEECNEMKANPPPPTWNGVKTMTEK